MHSRSDGSVVYVSETISRQFVTYHNVGPPTFQWNEVQSEAGYGWAGHAGHADHADYAGYSGQANEQAEVPVNDEQAVFRREAEPVYLWNEQWHLQNPPPGPQDD
ncbi:hypothetical protein LZ32DRAFT_603379, partial [Colletotrichum eremochloae]